MLLIKVVLNHKLVYLLVKNLHLNLIHLQYLCHLPFKLVFRECTWMIPLEAQEWFILTVHSWITIFWDLQVFTVLHSCRFLKFEPHVQSSLKTQGISIYWLSYWLQKQVDWLFSKAGNKVSVWFIFFILRKRIIKLLLPDHE